MKLDQQQQAKNLYFQTGLSKTEIAEALGISRRSLHYWISEGNWEQIKKNADVIPSFLAANCYQLLGDLTSHLLSADRLGQPATIQEVNAIYKLTLTINKLKAKSSLNESMETLALFADNVESKDPELAQKLQPHLEESITTHAAKGIKHYWQSKIAAVEKSSVDREAAELEKQLDMEDFAAWSQPQAHTQPQPHTTTQPRAHTHSAPQSTPQPKPANKSIREMLRGTASTGPSKNLRQPAKAA